MDAVNDHVLATLPAVELWALDRLCVRLDLTVHPDWMELLVARGWAFSVVEAYPGREDASGRPLTIKRYQPNFRAAFAYQRWCERVVARGGDDQITDASKELATRPRSDTVN